MTMMQMIEWYTSLCRTTSTLAHVQWYIIDVLTTMLVIMSLYSWKYIGCPQNDYDNPSVLQEGHTLWNTQDMCLAQAMAYYDDVKYPFKKVICVLQKPGLQYFTYRKLSTRLRSFKDWPPTIPVKAEDLAAAGFFYKGFGDKVTCFCCGINLKKWQPEDTAMGEHKKHSPECLYLTFYDTT